MSKGSKRRSGWIGTNHPGAHPRFMGLAPEHSRLADSRVVVLPVPYEGTTSYGAGTRNGPDAIIAASRQVELYDRRTGREPAADLGFHTLPPTVPDFSSPERMIAGLARLAAPLYRSGKFVLALGGEHTVTAGLVKAAAHRWRDLCVVQVDAHADLREAYEGTRFSHACAARRLLDALPRGGDPRLVQVGIRNISAREDAFRKAAGSRIRTFWAEDVLADAGGAWLRELVELVAGRPVYLTVDVDGLDPSVMPATGTPEPGGLLWGHAVALVEALAGTRNLVAADIVELAPKPDLHAPDFLAAKLGYLIAHRALGK